MDIDPSSLPPSIQAFMSLADLSGDDQHLDIELSTEIQGLENYKSYIFRLSLTPLIDTCAQTVQADVYHSTDPFADEQHVALLTGNLLHRPNQNFYMDADEINAELGSLASMFFNSNGKLSCLRNPQIEEIASRPGGFLWIYKVEVNPDHRGSDLGLQLVTQTLKFLRDKWTIAVMQPEPLSSHGVNWLQNAPPHLDGSSQALPVLKLRRHFSRLGFLQAGRDSYTACAMYLTASQFFPSRGNTLAWKTKQQAATIQFSAPEKHNPEGLHKQLMEIILYRGGPTFYNPNPFPLPSSEIGRIDRLLSAGASVHDSRALHLAAKQGADLSLFELLLNRGGDLNAPDESGDRPLHAAAREISLSVPHLIALGASREVRNINNETPFDVLEMAARIEQASVDELEDCKSKPSMRRMRNLRKGMIALMPDELKSQLIDGCLPPRIHKILILTTLHCDAAIGEVTNEVYNTDEQQPLAEMGGRLSFLEYIPVHVLMRNKEKLDSRFLIGWKHVFTAIALCLDRKKVPTVARIREILDELAPDGECDYFLEAGGKIKYAIDAVICEGYNAFRKESDHWTFDDYQDDIDALVCTPLDDLCNLVRALCFRGCEAPPYGPYESSIEMIYEYF